ncbi:metal-dependent phosphoesterase, PHP family [Candidatus Omnitrophus magneticus]|uniref:Metal-dependent phosphoesterase, PHP family n=1 Tax=Candidatus Omnitrophus magneticus TaxID=1609969 RepID=A0A0F0CU74_9BACT|nr:metal-dependent phosphoesterase, PHP family [Candidatus Omnitrophus magneticus]
MFSPKEVVYNAFYNGLKVIAITDHDTVEGIDPALEYAKNSGLEVIPGIEISARVSGKEIHVLGYFLDWYNPVLKTILDERKKARAERINKMVKLLYTAGFNITVNDVFQLSEHGIVGRLHLARILVSKGYVSSVKEAFRKYIGEGKPYHAEQELMDYKQAINLIKESGGVPVLAHPGVSKVEEFLPDIIKAGIKGLEVFHSEHTIPQMRKYFELAKKHFLLVTGGSDCHGHGKDKILMGKIKVSLELVEDLRVTNIEQAIINKQTVKSK